MAFEFKKGMIAVATSHSGGEYHYEKIDQYIEASSLNITPDSVQEKDSYRNANGLLKRPDIMPYTMSKIEFNVRVSHEYEMDNFVKILKKGVNVPGGIKSENKLRIRFYNPKTMDYSHAWAYYPDIVWNTYSTANGDLMYMQTRIAFITYGEKVD